MVEVDFTSIDKLEARLAQILPLIDKVERCLIVKPEPGAIIALHVRDRATSAMMEGIIMAAKIAFPDNRVIVLSGVDRIEVYAGDEAIEDGDFEDV